VPTRRDPTPRRLYTLKAWAVVSAQGRVVHDQGDNPEGVVGALAIYPRRYLAAVVASRDSEWRVVPIGIRSLQHHKR